MIKNNEKLFKIWYFFSTGFNIGNIFSICPGTLASLLAIPIWWIIIYFFSYRIYILFLILNMVMGVFICDRAVKFIGIHDHKSIILDEFIGMWMVLIIVPIYSIFWIIIAFGVFRILDIMKPWPIFWFDRNVKGGIGIIIDDFVASIISICIVFLFMQI